MIHKSCKRKCLLLPSDMIITVNNICIALGRDDKTNNAYNLMISKSFSSRALLTESIMPPHTAHGVRYRGARQVKQSELE